MAGSAVVGALRVVFGAETAAFEKGVSKVDRQLAATQKKFAKTADSLTSIGKKMSIGLTAPLAAFGVSAFKAASDAAEMESAFDVVFGNASDSVRKWAEETGNAMGRSTQEIQRGALAFQELFSKGLDPEKAVDMSKKFALLTQDLASFKNLSNEVAQQKLFSGLSGEAEPLRAVGVFINEAAVSAKALELGLTGVNGKLTDQEKIVARAALIQEQLANAQDDVMRTGGSTENQLKRTAAAFEELQVTVGTKLLPVLTPLIEKLAGALDWFSQLPEPVQNTALVVGAVTAAVGPLLAGFGGLISIMGLLLPALAPVAAGIASIATVIITAALPAIGSMIIALAPILIPLAAVAAAVGAVYLAYKNWDAIVGFVSRMVQGVKTWLVDNLGKILHAALNPIETVRKAFFNLYDAVVGHSYIPDMVDELGQHMRRLDAELVKPAVSTTSAAAQAFRALQQSVSTLFDRLFPAIARMNQMKAETELLNQAMAKGVISADAYAEAMRRLKSEASDDLLDGTKGPTGLNVGPIAEAMSNDELQKAIKTMMGAANDNADGVEAANVRIVDSFKDMAEKTMQSVQSFVGAIKGGGFLDVLEAGVGLFLQLGSTGLFGKGLQGRINAPGRAVGGNVQAGKPYIVGEKRPEMFIPSSSGRVMAGNDNGGGHFQVEVVANNNGFGAVIRNGAGQVVAEAAPSLMQGGAQVANSKMAYRQSRRIPGR